MTSPTTYPPANPTPIPQPPMQKKSGCGCCLWGCFILFIVAIISLVGGYFGLRYATNLILSDQAVTWAYQNIARDKIRQMLPPNWSEAEKDRVMAQADAGLQEFFTLPPEQKEVLKKEALIAIQYYSQGQIIPPEKIPNLQAFIERQIQGFEGRPANSPRLLQ